MEIYIGKITFEDAGNSGGGEITAPCYITQELKGYSPSVLNDSLKEVNEQIKYTNQKYKELITISTNNISNLYKNDTQLVYAPKIDTSKYNRLSSLFQGCTNLKYVPEYNMSNVGGTSIPKIFSGCTKLVKIEGVENWDTSNLTSLDDVFNGCKSLTSLDLSGWDTSNVTTMQSMFYGCSGLTSVGDLSNWDTSKVTIMQSVFQGCSKLTSLDFIRNWNVSKVNLMSSLFNGCSKLTSLECVENWDTSNVTSMNNMFYSCTGLTSLDLSNWDVSKVTSMSQMFYSMGSTIKTINLSGWDLSNIKYSTSSYSDGMNQMFYYASGLENLIMDDAKLRKNNIVSWNISSCSALTVESLVSVLNALPDLTGDGTSFTCTIGSTLLKKLSDEQVAIATNKGWVIN